MKPILYIMCGVPASGKTTWATKFYCQMEDTVYRSRDEIRLNKVFKNESLFSHEDEIFEIFVDEIAKWLIYYNVIADASHVNYSSRAKLIKHLEEKGVTKDQYDIIFVVMNTPYGVCVERDDARIGREHVTAEKIWDYYVNFVPPTLDEFENVKEIWTIKN